MDAITTQKLADLALTTSPKAEQRPPANSTSTNTSISTNASTATTETQTTAADVALFPATPWITSSTVQQSLPEGYRIRPLQSDDHAKGLLGLLAQLTTVGDVTQAMFLDRFRYMQSRAGDYFTIVIEDAQGVPVASGTILVERKFIRGCGLVGHIEDIVVDAGQRGKNLGRKIIDQLTHIGKLAGCYKVILCCDEKNVGFYEKCGYAKKEVEMALYF